MFGIRAFLFGTCLGAGAGYFALNYHVVHGPEGPLVVARMQRPPIRSAYVDVRNWSAAMWERYPDVTAALVQAGKGDVIAKGVTINSLLVPETTAPTWSAGNSSTDLKARTERGFTDLIDSLPPIKFEEEDPVPTSTIPAQTRRLNEDSRERSPVNTPVARTVPAARIGQWNEPAATSTPGTVPVSVNKATDDFVKRPEVVLEQLTATLGQPAPLPGARPTRSTVPPTVERRTVPQPPSGSPMDALKSLFGGSRPGPRDVAPRIDRAIKTAPF